MDAALTTFSVSYAYTLIAILEAAIIHRISEAGYGFHVR